MIVTYLLFGLLVIQSVMHYIERRDLYSRIMAKDLTDLSVQGKKVPSLENPILKAMKQHATRD